MADITTRQGKGIALTFDEVDANFENLNQELATLAASIENAAQKGQIVNADIANNAAIADSKLAIITTAGKVANSATSASSTNTPGAIVTRNGSGDFAAGTITAALSGNATTATRLQTPRTINGVAFDGTANITITGANTAQSLTAGSFLSATGTFDGSVARTFSVDATSDNTASKVVARDAGGGFSAGAVNLTSLAVSGNSTLSGELTVSGSTALGAATASTPATASDNTSIATTAFVKAQGYAPLASPAFTGTPTVPTAAVGTNTTRAASTAFVVAQVANDAPTKTGSGASGTWGIDISGNAASATKLAAARTINGVPFDGTANITIATGAAYAALSAGSYLTSSGVYDGSVARTFAVDATSINTVNKVVARDASGNFAAGGATLGSLSVTGSSTVGGTLNVTGTTTLGAANAATPASNDNSTAIATTAFVRVQGYAPLSSPALTGTPTAPTAPVNTSSTQVATTAFVLGQAGTSTPLVSSATSSSAGTSLRYAREDHVHPANQVTIAAAGGTTSGPVLTVTSAPGLLDTATIPSASATGSGVVTTGAQTFAGAKTFKDGVELSTPNELFSGGSSSSITDTTERFVFGAGGGAATICNSAGSVLNVFRVSGDGNLIRFGKAGAAVGIISVTGSTTTYGTSSDYRLKENITPLTGALDRLQQIPVCRFNFISDPSRTVDGFLAHEVQGIVPEAITGNKDAMQPVGNIVDESGNLVETAVPEPDHLQEGLQWTATGTAPVYQQIDQSKLVPLLTAAVQELQQRVEALEAQLAGT